MKTLSYLTLSIVLPILLSSCGRQMEAMDHSTYTISKSLTIDHQIGGPSFSDTLRLRDANLQFMQERGSLHGLTITSITCRVDDVQGAPPQAVSGILQIGDVKNGHLTQVATINDAQISSMMHGEHGMEMHNDGMEMMKDMMMHDDEMMMSFMCDSTSRDSMHFTMNFDFHMSAECDCMN